LAQFADIRYFVLIPSYNSGDALARTVASVLPCGLPLLVVIDGSTDDSQAKLEQQCANLPGWSLLTLPTNEGKGGAVLAGLDHGSKEGYTHAVVMDGDGQHDATALTTMVELSRSHPQAMILGRPIFGPEAPRERVRGRRFGNWWANLNTVWIGIDDSLFGLRIYPVEPSRNILSSIRTARRFDFDTELAIRLVWAGIEPVNFPTKVFYPPKEEGGVSHFRYLPDNLLLIATHTRLFFGMLLRLPRLLSLRRRWKSSHRV